MTDRFLRASAVSPHLIQWAVENVFPPARKKTLSIGSGTRSYVPADRRAFEVDPTSYLTDIAVTQVGSLRVSVITDRHGTICHTHEPGLAAYCLALVQHGSAELVSPGRKEPNHVSHGAGMIYQGLAGTSFTSSDTNKRLCVWIPSAKLRSALEALADRPIVDDIVFAPSIDTSAGTGASLCGLLNHMEQELSRTDSLTARGIGAELFEDLLCRSIVEGLDHNYSEWVRRPCPAADLRGVSRAEDYLHAHLGESVTLSDLARAAGCGVRSLQLAFREARDMTPMEALRQARLNQARLTLVRAAPGTSVTDVASRFGFDNAGRFAGLYRREFGENPLQTLRGRRQ